MKGVLAGIGCSAPECSLVHERRTGGYNYAIYETALDILIDNILTGIGTHELVFAGYCHIGKFAREFDCLGYINLARDINTAMADINSDFRDAVGFSF
jgi:hypothetical protein